jgi:hypothetical protein
MVAAFILSVTSADVLGNITPFLIDVSGKGMRHVAVRAGVPAFPTVIFLKLKFKPFHILEIFLCLFPLFPFPVSLVNGNMETLPQTLCCTCFRRFHAVSLWKR